MRSGDRRWDWCGGYGRLIVGGVMQVLPCEKTYRHDWWACPFVHPGESAKRRDPRLYKYSAVACPNAKQVQQMVNGWE